MCIVNLCLNKLILLLKCGEKQISRGVSRSLDTQTNMKTYYFILQSSGGIADEQVLLLMCSLTDRQVKVGRKKPLAFSSKSSSPSVLPVPRFAPPAYATLPQAPHKLTTGQEALPAKSWSVGLVSLGRLLQPSGTFQPRRGARWLG